MLSTGWTSGFVAVLAGGPRVARRGEMVEEALQKLPFRMVGLTGGIASGKSTVSTMLLERGLPLIDADRLAREVVEPGTEGLAAVIDAFGASFLTGGGHLDRPRLGQVVFADDEARKKLNAILHPRIAAATAERVQTLQREGAPLVVYDAPLIVENGLQAAMNLLIVVAVDRDAQLERLMARDGVDLDQANQRIDAQLPLERKIEVADVVIDNSGTVDATRRQVDDLLDRLPTLLWPQTEGAREALATWLNRRPTPTEGEK